MERISDTELFDLLIETLEHCGIFLLKSDPLDVEWHLFEEFDSNSSSFLHENSLIRLLDGQYISFEVYSLCQLLYEKFRKMEGTTLWNVESVQLNSDWHEILALSDKIYNMINVTP